MISASYLLGTNCASQHRDSAHLYTDPQFGFRIACPDSGWALTDTTGIQEVLVIIRSRAMIKNFIPNVTVSVESLPSMMTAREYGENNLQSLKDQGYEIISSGVKSIHRNAFYDLQCAQRAVQPALRFRHLCLVKDRLGLIITCTAPQEGYHLCESDFQFIVNSFRFL
jgi:hypothetical protein